MDIAGRVEHHDATMLSQRMKVGNACRETRFSRPGRADDHVQ